MLPSRVPGYHPALLDELTSSGEVMWAGQGSLPGSDGWVSLYFADTAPLLLAEPAEITMTPVHDQVLEALGGGGALFFRGLSDKLGLLDDQALATALWDLVWAGRVSGDTLAPLRATLGSGRPAHRPATKRRRAVLPSRSGPPTVGGRWWLLPEPAGDVTQRANAQAEVLLERHGVVTRGAVTAERLPGGFTPVYQVLRAYEESGRCRRGYFVEGLGGAQFALPGAVDRMRAMAPSVAPTGGMRLESTPFGTPPSATAPFSPAPSDTDPSDPAPSDTDSFGTTPSFGSGAFAGTPTDAAFARAGRRDTVLRAVVLAAADPANPYGAALPWPQHPGRGRAQARPEGGVAGRAGRRLPGALCGARWQDAAVVRRRRPVAARRGRAGAGGSRWRPRETDGRAGRRRLDRGLAPGGGAGVGRFPSDPRGLRLRA